jgi:C-terminal processing protease CtpA/Prc
MHPQILALLLAVAASLFFQDAHAQTTAAANPAIEIVSLKKEIGEAQRAKDWPHAIDAAEKLAAFSPKDAAGFFGALGEALMNAGEYSLAISVRRRAAELQPEVSSIWNSLCWTLILAQQPREARQACERMVALDPFAMAGTVNLGHTYLLQGQKSEAWDWYEKTIPLIDSESELKNGPLDDFAIFQKRGWHPELAREAQRWFEEKGKAHLIKWASLDKLMSEANAAARNEEYAKAIPLLEQGLSTVIAIYGEAHPRTANARNQVLKAREQYADQHDLQGRYNDALVLYREVLAAREKNPGGRLQLTIVSLNDVARTLEKLGRGAEAAPLLERAGKLSGPPRTKQYAYEIHAAVAAVSGAGCGDIKAGSSLNGGVFLDRRPDGALLGLIVIKQNEELIIARFEGTSDLTVTFPSADPLIAGGHDFRVTEASEKRFSAELSQRPLPASHPGCSWLSARITGTNMLLEADENLAKEIEKIKADSFVRYDETLRHSPVIQRAKSAFVAAQAAIGRGDYAAADAVLERSWNELRAQPSELLANLTNNIFRGLFRLRLENSNWQGALQMFDTLGVLTDAKNIAFKASLLEKDKQLTAALEQYCLARKTLQEDKTPAYDDKLTDLTLHVSRLLALTGKSGEAETELRQHLARLGQASEKTEGSRFALLGGLVTLLKKSGQQDEAKAVDQQLLVLGKAELLAHLRKHYLWNQDLPQEVSPEHDSMEETLKALRHKPEDHFSYIVPLEESDSASRGDVVGLGINFSPDQQRRLRVSVVVPGSPADHAGIRRGDIIEGFGGKTMAELRANPVLFGAALGENRAGVKVRIALVSQGGAVRVAEVAKGAFNTPAIPIVRTLQMDGHKIGYLHVGTFLSIGEKDVNEAIARLKADGVKDLVMDLRYNGGGRLDMSGYLAAAVAGKRVKDEIYQRMVFNATSGQRESTKFPDTPGSLDLPRLVVLSTEDTCSASEALVNGLRPFIPVTLVGSATCGKPLGMKTTAIGPWMLAPVTFQLMNARDEGGYFSGMKPDCAAPDDLDHALGDPAEQMLAEALGYLTTGKCSGRVMRGARAPLRREVMGIEKSGLNRETGVF